MSFPTRLYELALGYRRTLLLPLDYIQAYIFIITQEPSITRFIHRPAMHQIIYLNLRHAYFSSSRINCYQAGRSHSIFPFSELDFTNAPHSRICSLQLLSAAVKQSNFGIFNNPNLQTFYKRKFFILYLGGSCLDKYVKRSTLHLPSI